MDEESMRKTLELIAGNNWKDSPFKNLKISEMKILVDEINEKLKNTPFMYLVCADGLNVVSREAMVNLTKETFDKPYGDYSG